MAAKKTGLGRGLNALLGDSMVAASAPADLNKEGLVQLAITKLQPGKYQPRRDMKHDTLSELANSIRAQGIIQPIVVRPLSSGQFEIIAGERRWRAAQIAELRDVPVVVREVDDRAVIAMALIENIQREDLNPLEEASSLHRLIDEFDLTHQEAAEAVGRSRAAVSNLLRLLELPEAIRKLVENSQLEMGHARALLTLPANLSIPLAQTAAAEQLSVREVERRAQQAGKNKPAAKAAAPVRSNADIDTLEREIGEHLGAKVQVNHGKKGSGKLVIHYHGLDTLDGILEKLRR
ncbi:MAG: ParB/RepB/Spo0J family partition protein [Arenimonas sp.]|nr:ParB/RepB/Spo0J family partition protein [Arenimonas sp.]